jgi:hypothetical protein
MSIFIRRFPLHLFRNYTACQSPDRYNHLSTTFKVNVCMIYCTMFICGTINKAVDVLQQDNKNMEKQLQNMRELK